jgi:hypothetical protein
MDAQARDMPFDRAFSIVHSGDLIVIQVDEVEPMLKRVMEHYSRRFPLPLDDSTEPPVQTNVLKQ